MYDKKWNFTYRTHPCIFLAKINSVIDPAEKGIFKIVCERFKIENSDLKLF